MTDERKYLGKPLEPIEGAITFSEEELARANARAKRQSPLLWQLINAQPITPEQEKRWPVNG